MTTSYRTSLKNVRGLGALKGGTEHFVRQRVTGVSNIVVIAFLVYAILSLAGHPRADVKEFFAMPLNAIFGVLLGLSVPTHMRLGMQVIIEDYIHGRWKMPLLLLNAFFAIFIAVAILLAVIKLYLGV